MKLTDMVEKKSNNSIPYVKLINSKYLITTQHVQKFPTQHNTRHHKEYTQNVGQLY